MAARAHAYRYTHRRLGEYAMTTMLLLLAALTLAQGDAKSSEADELAAKVKQLVGKQGLGNDELAKREAAEKDLVELGPDVLPLLPTVTPRTPAEDKIRLQRVRTKLENAALAAVTKPSMDRLTGEMLL